MLQIMQLHELPPVPAGYLRVIRGERPRRPKDMACYHPDWTGLPCPQEDGIEQDFSHLNCAAYIHTLDEWWPEHERAEAMACGLHFIVLDVPKKDCREGGKQAMILRDAAIPVALIH